MEEVIVMYKARLAHIFKGGKPAWEIIGGASPRNSVSSKLINYSCRQLMVVLTVRFPTGYVVVFLQVAKTY